MKIMWLCNYPVPTIAEKAGLKVGVNEGWLQNLSRILSGKHDIELIYVFPQSQERKLLVGKVEGIEYIGFYAVPNRPNVADPSLDAVFIDLLQKYKPNVVHIMGTEFAHSLVMTQSVQKEGMGNSMIVSIQGMPSFLAKHMLNGIPQCIYHKLRLKDILYHTSLLQQQKQMKQRGENEKKVLQNCQHVFGRTDWDYACSMQINRHLQYHHGGEILRECFYHGLWKRENIEKHSIFFSQANSPIKGLHVAVESFGILAQRYPDLKVYVGGHNSFHHVDWKLSSYEHYVMSLIRRFGLANKIIFTGPLDAEKMMNRYLSSHVFVSASLIENSPNSVGEAMLLGMPVVSSDVGGVRSMLIHGQEGYLYPVDEPYMLAHYVETIFEDDELAISLGSSARKHAMITHNKETVAQEVYEVYRELSSPLIHNCEEN